MSIFQRYGHVFWIPFFPMGKTGVSVCNNCKQILKLKEMPESFRLAYDNARLGTKIPVWTFSGIALVILLFIGATIHGKQNQKKIAQWVQAPKTGDILEIKEKENQFTLYKVISIKKDSVYLVINNFQTDSETDIYKLKEKGFDTVVNVLSKVDYAGLNTAGKIVDIDRD